MLGPFQFLVKLLKTEISNLGNNTFKKVKQNCVFFLFFNTRLSRPNSSESNEPIFTKISGLVDG